MLPLERVKQFLAELPFAVKVIELADDTHTASLAAQALGTSEGQIAKSLVFETKSSKALMVVTSGDMRVDLRKLKTLIGEKVKFADPAAAEEITGFPPGGVCPFALKNHKMRVFIDKSLERFPIVYAAAGTAHSAVPVTVSELLMITGGDLVDLA